MGLSSSKSTTKPVYSSQIEGAYNTAKSAFDANQPQVQATAATMTGLGNSLIDRFNQGDPTVRAATGYATDVLGGKYLSGNPQLQAMIDQTNSSVANGVNAHLGTRGLTGGSAQQQLLARELAKNETGLRYGDYNAERDRMAQAAAMTPSLTAAQYQALSPGLSALQAGTMLPTDAANQFAAGVGGLLGQYTTTKQTMPIGQLLAQIAGNAASAFVGGGF